MPGSYSRQKGHGFEREVAKELRELGFPKARTSRQVSRLADDCKIDIVGCFPFAPQCKNLKTYASPNEVLLIDLKTFCEATDDVRTWIPMLITKANNKPVMATLPWEELKKLISPHV